MIQKVDVIYVYLTVVDLVKSHQRHGRDNSITVTNKSTLKVDQGVVVGVNVGLSVLESYSSGRHSPLLNRHRKGVGGEGVSEV